MRQVSKITIVLFVLMLGTSWFLSSCNSDTDTTAEKTPILVWEYKNQTAFDTVYPQGWEYFIVREGIMVFAPDEVTYEAESGPSMTILREAPGVSFAPLREELDHFLEYGPLREDYILTSEVTPVDIGGYEGLEVAIEREATEMFIPMKGVIYVVRADSGALYTFIASAPTEQWDQNWPLLLVISQNINFNE
jgi:hypothetical protein